MAGCAVCDTGNNPWAFLIREEIDPETLASGGITVWVNEDKLCVSADDDRAFSVYGETRINFCPMCGKRLL